MAIPETESGNNNGVYLKIIIGLLSLSGTLFSIIGFGILSGLDDLKKQMQLNTTGIAVHETNIVQLRGDLTSLQGDVKGLIKWAAMYALKPDEVGKRKRYIGEPEN